MSEAATLARTSDTPSEAGAAVTNRADGSYETEGNKVSGTTVTTTANVKSVSGVKVTPDETSPSTNTAPNERITKVFRICNSGNGPDSFTIPRTDITAPATLVSLHFDADASGTLHETPQRQYFCIVDGLISGEGNGPLQPLPRQTDWLVFGDDPFAIDAALSWFMGFAPEKLPVIARRTRFAGRGWGGFALDELAVDLDGKRIRVAESEINFHFAPPPGWRKYIER